MPCRSDYLEPNERERESVCVMEFLREIKGEPFNHDHPPGDIYGRVQTLDADTNELCYWCYDNPKLLKRSSLELQLWWQRHQKADRERERSERAHRLRERVKKTALGKLTPAERKALGVDE